MKTLVRETSLTYLFRAYCWRANVLHTLLLSSDSKFFFLPDYVHYLCHFYSFKLLFYSLDKGAPFRFVNRKNSCFFQATCKNNIFRRESDVSLESGS